MFARTLLLVTTSAWIIPVVNAQPHPSGTSTVDHWAFQPLQEVLPPRIDDPWITNSVDAFVLARLRDEGLSPSPVADARILVRRIHLVMHGLPPSLDELNRWSSPSTTTENGSSLAADDISATLGAMIDRGLGSPRYGERWAQHWLDIIRWAETWGYESNLNRRDAWHYRDWLIQALNNDKPYDEFVFEQIAGDSVGVDAATGFLVAGPANQGKQVGKDEESMRRARQDALDEVVKTVSAAFLGLTVGCARCHDHRFDPITQHDYYALQAVFSGLHYNHRRLRGQKNDRWTAQAVDAKRKLERLRSKLEHRRKSLRLRSPIKPEKQVELFEPVAATAIRISIEATHNGTPPSLYELEAWTSQRTGSVTNVALSANGSRADASSFALENQTRHPDNLTDGRFDDGGRFPWVAIDQGPSWARVDFAKTFTIDRIVWQRGTAGIPVDYRIEARNPDGQWTKIASSRHRFPIEADLRLADQIDLPGVDREEIADLTALLEETRSADEQFRRLTDGPQVFAGQFQEPETTYLLHRGNSMKRGPAVAPGVPAALGGLSLTSEAKDVERRIALARHIARGSHPLTARVMVNRIWQHIFGTGLVETPSDFGHMGSPPSHPQLLDWLAMEFVRGGWSIKHVQRLILESNTFRQSSMPREATLQVDADCRLLWRFPPRRLEAEVIRDSILYASGKLDQRMYGEGFSFFTKTGGLTDYMEYVPKEKFGHSSWRRMIYATKVRMQTVDVFGTFDCPDAGQMTPRRTRSITPIQALGLLNSPFVIRHAGFFARRVRLLAGSDPDERISVAMRLALSRPPTSDEVWQLSKLSRQHGLKQVCRVLYNTNEFLFLQ